MTDKKKQLQLQLEHQRKLDKKLQSMGKSPMTSDAKSSQGIIDPFGTSHKLVTPSQLIASSQPSSALEVANKFTVLGTVPKPSYQTVLETAFDPFASSPSPKQAFQYHGKSSPYFQKPPLNLFAIEPNSSNYKSPALLARYYFPAGWHFPAYHPSKNLKYFTDILFHTKSVKIKPIYKDANTKKDLLYHHLYVVRFISESAWGFPPHHTKPLPITGTKDPVIFHDIPFSYHDYIDAWYKVFLYQFENFAHSWFVQFDRDFKGPFPAWFLRWWHVHGPCHNILPVVVKDAVKYFSTVYKVEEGHQSLFPSSLHFFAFFGVPWIVKWQYIFSDGCIARQFSVKWWDKYNFSLIQEQLYSEFSAEQLSQTSPEVQLQPELISRLPPASMALKAPKASKSVSSASSSKEKSGSSKSKSSAKAKKPSRKDILAMAEVLLQQASEGDDEDEDNASSAESESSIHLDQLNDSYQDAQDPFDHLSEAHKSTKSHSKGRR
ncbi:hypothetical protein SLA2020_432810 [Shorea laevis]